MQGALASGFALQARVADTGGTQSTVNFPVTYFDRLFSPWELVVLRLEWNNLDVSGLISISGQPWVVAGTGSQAKPEANSSSPNVGFQLNTTSTTLEAMDEAVFWKNAPRFSNQELQNLYNLDAVYGLTMDHYSEQFTPKASGTMPCYTSGPIFVSGSLPCYTAGPFASSGDIPCYLHVSSAASGDLPLNLGGIDSLSGSLPLYCQGFEVASGSLDLVVLGGYIASGSMPMVVWQQLASGDIPLFLSGILGKNTPLFLRAPDGTLSGSLPLALYGSSSGTTVSSTFADMPMFVSNDSGLSSMGRTGSLFLRAPSGFASSRDSRSLFMRVGPDNIVRVSGALSLFTSGPNSVSGRLPCLIAGSGSKDSAGYTPVSKSGSLFLRTHTGAVAEFPLFCSGFVYPSGSIDMYLFGIQGASSGSLASYLEGYKQDTGTLDCNLFAVFGVPSGSMNLVILGPDLAPVSGLTPLYTHGF